MKRKLVSLGTACALSALVLGGMAPMVSAYADTPVALPSQEQQEEWPNNKVAFDFFVQKGMTPEVAAGFIGNFMVESGSDNIDPSAVQDGGPGRGIAQWTVGERFANLEALAAQRGTQWDDLETQLEFVWQELQGDYSQAYEAIKGATSPEEAAQLVSDEYEKPDKDYAKNDVRQQNARAVYDRFKDNKPGDDTQTPAPATPEDRVVRQGDTGEEVKTLQNLLNTRHGFKIEADGDFGPETAQAVRAFQERAKIDVDGVVGPQTWEKLRTVITPDALPVLRQGDKNSEVELLQTTLRDVFGYPLDVDGDFGPDTADAVRTFQGHKGIDVDGVVGPDTWRALAEGKVDKKPSKPGQIDGKKYEDTRGLPNGEVPEEYLCEVPFDPEKHKVACYMLDDFVALNEAYKAEFGEDIDINQDEDTAYRTLEQQQVLWDKYGAPRAAEPGTSNHGWGLAVDLYGVEYGNDKYNWLDANAPNFGFDDDVPDEDWHWAYQR